MNKYLADLLQRIAPALQRMPQLPSMPTQFAGQRPPPQGLFGPGMIPPAHRQLPTLPYIPLAQPRRRQFGIGAGGMPRLDLTQFTPALNNAPGFAPPAPIAPPVAAPAVAPAQAPLPPSGWSPAMANDPNYIFDVGVGQLVPRQAQGGGSGWTPGMITTV